MAILYKIMCLLCHTAYDFSYSFPIEGSVLETKCYSCGNITKHRIIHRVAEDGLIVVPGTPEWDKYAIN